MSVNARSTCVRSAATSSRTVYTLRWGAANINPSCSLSAMRIGGLEGSVSQRGPQEISAQRHGEHGVDICICHPEQATEGSGVEGPAFCSGAHAFLPLCALRVSVVNSSQRARNSITVVGEATSHDHIFPP